MRSVVSRADVCAVVCVLAFLTAGTPAWAAPPCRNVTGTVQTQQTTAGCQSPIGLCFSGTLKTNSFLRGDTFFTATGAQPDPDQPHLLHYQGVLVVTLPSGRTVSLQSNGVLDTSTQTFTETDVASGNPEADLTMTGTTNATISAFTGKVTGQLCGTPPRK